MFGMISFVNVENLLVQTKRNNLKPEYLWQRPEK